MDPAVTAVGRTGTSFAPIDSEGSTWILESGSKRLNRDKSMDWFLYRNLRQKSWDIKENHVDLLSWYLASASKLWECWQTSAALPGQAWHQTWVHLQPGSTVELVGNIWWQGMLISTPERLGFLPFDFQGVKDEADWHKAFDAKVPWIILRQLVFSHRVINFSLIF